ncbi:MAG TPA: hypothetical protein PLV84_09890 [Deltaproteobacteria bacterium]|nr:hypothetical protein [Deltaproteobacteria bacterium]
MNRHTGRLISICCSILIAGYVISGCSSGSTGTHEGRFVDSPVEGLAYETPSVSGTTDSQGAFLFSSSEQVTFSIGGIVLGTTRARTVLTPLDLVPGATDESNPSVINIARLLITLDRDNDPDNGITIIPEIGDALADVSVLFNQTPEAFTADPGVQDVVETVNDIYTAVGEEERPLCPQETAMEHLGNTLDELEDYAPDNNGSSGGGGGAGGGGG